MLFSTYDDYGLGIQAHQETANLFQKFFEFTKTEGVQKGMANFGGLFDIGDDKILVAGTNGVGTKLKLAFALNKHEAIGIDLAAMCINDIACHGAKPLFFLDYIAMGKIYPEKIEKIVSGIAQGCKEAKCALLGGETANMPGFYKADEYDLAGFAVGIVDKDKLIDGSTVSKGDVIIGFASNGVHSSGFAMIRNLFSLDAVALNHYVDTLQSNLADELMKPSRIYSETILSLARRFLLKGVAHITGGGMVKNIPRILPQGLRANIKMGSWPILPVFEIIRAANKTPITELFNVFNMGIGLVVVVSADCAEAVLRCACELNENAYIIGEVIKGDPGITITE